MKGELLAAAASAEIFAWGRDAVLKLFRPEYAYAAHVEAERTRAVHAAGLPAPEVRDEVTLEGRPGIVLERIEGPTLLSELARGGAAVREVGVRLAEIHRALHAAAPASLPRALDTLRKSLAAADPGLREEALPIVDALPDGAATNHGDLHPGNVILSARGPVLVDWVNAHLAHPALDVARSLVLLRYQSSRRTRSAERLALRQALADTYLEAMLDAGHVSQAELGPSLAWASHALLHSGAVQDADVPALRALARPPQPG
ncbi:MAG: phosphotransferase [Myxococcota bacterium]|nr:phosphotransferase [Myxococcota bacterium]